MIYVSILTWFALGFIAEHLLLKSGYNKLRNEGVSRAIALRARQKGWQEQSLGFCLGGLLLIYVLITYTRRRHDSC